jgi:hypothetical protein
MMDVEITFFVVVVSLIVIVIDVVVAVVVVVFVSFVLCTWYSEYTYTRDSAMSTTGYYRLVLFYSKVRK